MLHPACNDIRSHPNSFHCRCRHCQQLNYDVDSNTKSLNYIKIQFKALILFELEQTSIKTSNYSHFELDPVKFTSNWWNFELTMFKLTVYFKHEMIGIWPKKSMKLRIKWNL